MGYTNEENGQIKFIRDIQYQMSLLKLKIKKNTGNYSTYSKLMCQE